jgi:hypothetical protein
MLRVSFLTTRHSPVFTHSPAFLLFAASRRRFYCRLWLPLPVAVWQAKICPW